MNIWEAVLFCLGIVAVILCLLTLRKLDLKTKKKDLEVELEHLLLIVTQWGVFMYFLFQLIGGVQMVKERDTDDFMRYGILLITSYIVSIRYIGCLHIRNYI